MNKKEFIKKYCNAPVSASDCAQITWDLLEEIEDELNDDSTENVDACLYTVETLLEVMNPEIPDYKFWGGEVYEDLKKLKNDNTTTA